MQRCSTCAALVMVPNKTFKYHGDVVDAIEPCHHEHRCTTTHLEDVLQAPEGGVQLGINGLTTAVHIIARHVIHRQYQAAVDLQYSQPASQQYNNREYQCGLFYTYTSTTLSDQHILMCAFLVSQTTPNQCSNTCCPPLPFYTSFGTAACNAAIDVVSPDEQGYQNNIHRF